MKTRFSLSLVAFLVTCCLISSAQMSPADLDILLTRVGPDNPAATGPLALRAGVSTIIQLSSGRILAAFQWFPEDQPEAVNKIAVRFSDDGGTGWSPPQVADFIDLPSNITRQFDPTLVALADGRVRMYFTGNPDSSRVLNENTGIYSAVSTDGIHYVYEEGERFGVDDAPMIDCAVVRTDDEFHLYSPIQGAVGTAYHATSSDGLAFERQDDLVNELGQNWLGCAVFLDGRVRFYGTLVKGKGLFGSMWFADAADGADFGVAQAYEHTGFGSDPGVVHLDNGNTLITSTGKFTPAEVDDWNLFR
ncbi:MAG: exo-alpha-sialidase [Candidatus Hinthialibacter antarcticus]|nr:exo-alpha-sialidase [Candidatus Hinthialibacter antarcticus]